MAHGLLLHSMISLNPPRLEQSFPPCAGDGFVQVRCLSWVPLPHDTLHFDHEDQFERPPLTGHGFIPQLFVTVFGPMLVQDFPPCAGDGLVHVRLRVQVPPPHVLVHFDQDDQGV